MVPSSPVVWVIVPLFQPPLPGHLPPDYTHQPVLIPVSSESPLHRFSLLKSFPPSTSNPTFRHVRCLAQIFFIQAPQPLQSFCGRKGTYMFLGPILDSSLSPTPHLQPVTNYVGVILIIASRDTYSFPSPLPPPWSQLSSSHGDTIYHILALQASLPQQPGLSMKIFTEPCHFSA